MGVWFVNAGFAARLFRFGEPRRNGKAVSGSGQTFGEVEDAPGRSRLNRRIAGATKDPKPALSPKNHERNLARVTFLCQASTSTLDVVEFKTVRSITPSPSAARALRIPAREQPQGTDSAIPAILTHHSAISIRMGLPPTSNRLGGLQ